MKKPLLLFITTVLFLIFFLFFLINNKTIVSRSIISNYYPELIYSSLSMIFDSNINSKRISNDYNVLFLPKTQYVSLGFEKKKLDFLWEDPLSKRFWKKRKSFFLEIFEDKIFFTDTLGNFYYSGVKKLKNKELDLKKIKTNLEKNSSSQLKVLDFHIFKKKIFVSKVLRIDQCNYLTVDIADINLEFLEFKNIFSSQNANECVSGKIQGGKIENFNLNKILVTASADIDFSKDTPDVKAQNDNSLFGKTLLIDTINPGYEIYNKGHRVSLGLLVDDKFIFSTENGPRGGDEINLELKGKNYGWGLASYGSKYSKNELFLDHEKHNFQEPIFSFIPSIGISEIIKLNDNFANEWYDNYLVASLNYKHLIRLKLNKDKTKVLFTENIYIGERIRDLGYIEKEKIIVLALEDSGSIGILFRK
ncbi:PQQ-dependent sugar dehydrogenase [Candidatus Pelagibacter bacterium]|jgi:hypothetical protein|nr:PQQ-dependent sugar dehydrogenase [Candidatus Pelagibacter bacterium]